MDSVVPRYLSISFVITPTTSYCTCNCIICVYQPFMAEHKKLQFMPSSYRMDDVVPWPRRYIWSPGTSGLLESSRRRTDRATSWQYAVSVSAEGRIASQILVKEGEKPPKQTLVTHVSLSVKNEGRQQQWGLRL
jgi:hypothetical protein